jgi:hypothetical protein
LGRRRRRRAGCLAGRPAVKAIVAESDPRKALWLWVRTANEIAARTAPLGEVLTAAADIDPAAAELLAEARRNRLLGATAFVKYLASLGGLAAGVTEQRAGSRAELLVRAACLISGVSRDEIGVEVGIERA